MDRKRFDIKCTRINTLCLEERLTVHIQTVVSNPLLPAQCWVERLAAQCRPIVFPFYRDPDGAGHAECLPVVLLGYHTWRETEGMRRWKEKKTGGAAKTQVSSQNMPALPFSLLRHHTYCMVGEGERQGGRREAKEEETFRGDHRWIEEVSRQKGRNLEEVSD